MVGDGRPSSVLVRVDHMASGSMTVDKTKFFHDFCDFPVSVGSLAKGLHLDLLETDEFI
jgi:hypothetical protein